MSYFYERRSGMKILSEYELRAMHLPLGTEQFEVDEDTFIMPGAREYLKDRGIKLVLRKIKQGDYKVMPKTPIPFDGENRYIDAQTGKGYSEKGEEMTHLHGNVLVPKTHPRIVFRGRLDSLVAKILETQFEASNEGCAKIVQELEEVLDFVRSIISAEVNEKPLEDFKLLGMDSQRLRYCSHHVFEEYGIEHLMPDYRMGRLCIALNSLRTAVRETELSAAAFEQEGQFGRKDIIEALNRLSSCIYILYCRKLSGYYKNK
jgi:ethanolamine utilization cobalamin adenosyltransferase